MSETMIATLIGAGVSLITAMFAQLMSLLIEKYKSQQNDYKMKRKQLNDTYTKLIDIVHQFPNSSPNDILQFIECAPSYSMELFEAVLKDLNYQIEDYKKQMINTSINLDQKKNIETQIINIENAKQKISEIRNKYNTAKENYKQFCESDKAIFELYASQDVRNSLVEFEAEIHNAFISGHCVGVANDLLNNRIEVIRRKLINSIRNDIGIY